jgi:hypothetical protein
MAWIIGLKPVAPATEGAFVDQWIKEPPFSLAELQIRVPQRYGGVATDYSFYQLSANELDKITDGQSRTFIWSNGEITGIDFSNETSKPWVKLSATKTYIANDGVDSTVITLEVWKPNLSEIAANVQRNAFRVTIETPNGVRYVRINIINGVGTATFKTTVAGPYTFPSEAKRFGTMRIFNQLKIYVDELTLLS